jgi:phytoene dehydrogenase-like protein
VADRLVASAVDLHQTFLDLIEPVELDTEFRDKVGRFLLDEFSIFGVHLALKQPPRHRAADRNPDLDQAFKLNVGLESPDDFTRLFSQIRRDRLPDRPGLFCSVPTLFDPTQAPPGRHTAFLWQPAPYRPDGRDPSEWDKIKSDFAEFCIDGWRRYAPNLTPDNILAQAALSPLDMERKLINMRAGAVFMGRMNLAQVEYFRPLPELAEFRTPIDRLYLCGACCHPGGGIIGAAGLIAAETIAEDLGVDKWWA